MRDVTVKKDELLEKLELNKDNHRAKFLEAQKVYREQYINELERMLKDARRGDKIRREITLPMPVDHTSDYNAIIEMIKRHVEDTIVLQEEDVRKYIMDQWNWMNAFTATTEFYAVA